MSNKLVRHDIKERPTEYAERLGSYYAGKSHRERKRKFGQYMTPLKVADFMASCFPNLPAEIDLLDPGAGTGILTCAFCERLAYSRRSFRINLTAYELDKDIIHLLDQSLSYLKEWLFQRGIDLSFIIKNEDFILSNQQNCYTTSSLFSIDSLSGMFDCIICNPPYFKVSRSDPRAKAVEDFVYGQPNIYALFLGMAANLLKKNGEMVVITPRSFTSGPYFGKFRRKFFSMVTPTSIHLFDSRKDAFNHEGILQENVIMSVRKDCPTQKDSCEVQISCSRGANDLDNNSEFSLPLQKILNFEDQERVLGIPTSDKEIMVLNLVKSWVDNFGTLGIDISTGPVVAFRATNFICYEGDLTKNHVPLLWMNHVKPMSCTWPISSCKKQQYIVDAPETSNLLASNENYILVRRFSSKEQARRLMAAPYIANNMDIEVIGLENHLNYIYRPKGELTVLESYGLAAILNCETIDIFFRIFNGNTQVSATELRNLPLPPCEVINLIGEYTKDKKWDQRIDEWVCNVLMNIR